MPVQPPSDSKPAIVNTMQQLGADLSWQILAFYLLVPLALARAAAERLPRARLTVLDGVGHMPWLEAPRELAADPSS